MPSTSDAKYSKTVVDSPIDNARAKLAKTTFFGVYIILSTLLAITEPLLVGFPSRGIAYTLQVFVLSMSTIFFFIGIILCVSVMKSTALKKVESIPSKVFACFDAEAYIEFVSLIVGWVFIFESPGYAALRCFRVFRYLWYFELFEVDDNDGDNDPEEKIMSITKASQLCLEYLEQVGTELGTEASRGGTIILSIYFFVTYIFGVIAYNYSSYLTDDDIVSNYSSLSDNFVLMMRLTLFDAAGFDYLSAVMSDGQNGYAVLLFGYIIFNSFILLNGLIGVFMAAFTEQDDDDDDDKKKKKKKSGEEAGLLDDDDDDDDDDEDDKLYKQVQVELQLLKREIQSVKKILNAPAFDSGFTLLEWKVADVKKFL